MIFDLVRDFADALDAMPTDHPRHRLLKLLDEAIRRDIHFIAHHREDYPQALFQCAWNNGWWYDCPEAVQPVVAHTGHLEAKLPSEYPETVQLSSCLVFWRENKTRTFPELLWIRTLRPPLIRIGSGLLGTIAGAHVNELIYSPDGTKLIARTEEQHGGVHNSRFFLTTYDLASSFFPLRHFAPDLKSIRFVDDNLVEGRNSQNGRPEVWDCITGELVSSTESRLPSVQGAGDTNPEVGVASCDPGFAASAFNDYEVLGRSDDGRLLACGGTDGEMSVVDHGSGQVVFKCSNRLHQLANPSAQQTFVSEVIPKQHPNNAIRVVIQGEDSRRVTCASFASHSSLVTFGTADGVMYLVDYDRREIVASWAGHEGRIQAVVISPTSSTLATISNGNVFVWKLSEVHSCRTEGSSTDVVTKVSFGGASPRFATATSDGTIRVWNIESGRLVRTYYWNVENVLALAMSPDGNNVAASSSDGQVNVWNNDAGVEVASLSQYAIFGLTFLSDSKWIACVSDRLRIWDVHACSPGFELGFECPESVRCVAFSSDNECVVLGVVKPASFITRMEFLVIHLDRCEIVSTCSIGGHGISPGLATATLCADARFLLIRSQWNVWLFDISTPRGQLVSYYRVEHFGHMSRGFDIDLPCDWHLVPNDDFSSSKIVSLKSGCCVARVPSKGLNCHSSNSAPLWVASVHNGFQAFCLEPWMQNTTPFDRPKSTTPTSSADDALVRGATERAQHNRPSDIRGNSGRPNDSRKSQRGIAATRTTDDSATSRRSEATRGNAADPCKKGLLLIRQGDPIKAIEHLIVRVYAPGRIPVRSDASAYDVLCLAAAFIAAGEISRARQLANDCNGKSRQAAEMINQFLQDWKSRLNWFERISYNLFGYVPSSRTPDYNAFMAVFRHLRAELM